MIQRHNKQIVCISPHYWKGFWFRKQHFMSRFHKNGYKIAYIDPSFSMVRKPDFPVRDCSTNGFWTVRIEEIDHNCFIIKPPRYLPFHTRPFARKLNNWYVLPRISSILQKLGFNNYILWIYVASHADILGFFDYGKLIFDMADDLVALVGNNARKCKYIENCTTYLLKKSDLVLVTSYPLLDKYKNDSGNIHLVPNGYEASLFSNKKHVSGTPSELKDISTPVVGFVGTLRYYYDYNLLEYIIEGNPDKSFVFVGACSNEVTKAWGKILNHKNVIWLGRKKQEEIPAIIDKFDACINPFKIDEVSKSASPLKVFDYLAMKKPVVSVMMESLKRERISKLIYFAKDYNEFNHKLNFALKNSIPNSEYECIKKYSWDSLFDKAFDLVERFC